MSDFRPTLCIDFDGVINPYSRGWQGGELYETEVTPGFFEWALHAQKLFKLVIYSSRSKDETLLRTMQEWMHERYAEWVRSNSLDLNIPVIGIEYTHEKPAAWITIDDRAIRFDGDWSAESLSPEMLRAFKPWNAKP
jgi:hypothetical protein